MDSEEEEDVRLDPTDYEEYCDSYDTLNSRICKEVIE